MAILVHWTTTVYYTHSVSMYRVWSFLTALLLIITTHIDTEWGINTAMCYSRNQLLELNTSACHDVRLPTSVYKTITTLGINCKPATRRGTQAGRSKILLPTLRNIPTSRVSASQSTSDYMNVSLWNAQSIRNKIPTLHDNILCKNSDIVFITETWIQENDQVVLGELHLPGYSVFSVPRTNQGGGGVGVVFKSKLKLEIINNQLPHSSSFEHALIYDRQNNVNFVIIYRSSSLSVSAFLPEFEDFLAAVDLLPGRSILLGDFNVWHDCPSRSEVRRAITIMDSLLFTQLVRGPTHIGGHTLDWIVTKENDCFIDPHTITPLHVSDHFYIDCKLDLHKTRDVKTTYTSRNYRSIDSDAFDRDLAVKFSNILSLDHPDINSLVRSYNQACTEVLDHHAPPIVRTRTIRRKPLWFDDSVADARRSRRRCEHGEWQFRQSRIEVDREAYFNAQKTVSITINHANDKLGSCDSKDMFKIVNEFLNRNDRSLPNCASSQDLANQINSVIFSLERLK